MPLVLAHQFVASFPRVGLSVACTSLSFFFGKVSFGCQACLLTICSTLVATPAVLTSTALLLLPFVLLQRHSFLLLLPPLSLPCRSPPPRGHACRPCPSVSACIPRSWSQRDLRLAPPRLMLRCLASSNRSVFFPFLGVLGPDRQVRPLHSRHSISPHALHGPCFPLPAFSQLVRRCTFSFVAAYTADPCSISSRRI